MQTSSGAMCIGFVEERGDVFFLARIQPARLAAPACGFDFGFQGGEFFRGAAAGEDGVAFGGEALGDGRADEIARADHGRGGVLAASHSLNP